MTEEIQSGLDTSSSADVSSPVESGDVSASVDSTTDSPTPDAPPIVEEKTLTQSQVNKLIAREKRDAAAKAEQAFQQRLQQQQQQQSQQNDPNVDIRQQIRLEAQRMSAETRAAEIINQFESKIKQAISSDPDFADDYDALNIENHPNLVLMTNELDNTAEVIRDLAQNPGKFSSVLNLVNSGSPEMAKRELQKLAASIKQNKAAMEQKKAPAPLGQIKPSNVLTGDGKPSVTSFMSKFRG